MQLADEKPVALLFAGSDTRTFASPIDPVLSRFGATIDGAAAAPPPPPPGGFTLTATGYKVKGLQKVDLDRAGASGSDVDVYRDGALVATTENDGAYTDNIDRRDGGSYSYQVCEQGTTTCSGEVTASF